jgi:hypothetical protein
MEKPINGTILVPFSVVEDDDGTKVTKTGTLALTGEQAAALGVRPGYTPGALYLKNAPADLPHLLTRNNQAGSQNQQPITSPYSIGQ